MRIISGVRRGKKLMTLGGQNTRPTLERVKQSIFDTIQMQIQGRKVLDLFAGSGQMGLESLSRGAEFCYFNDIEKAACKVVDHNIKCCGFEKISKLYCQSYEKCVKMLETQCVKLSLVFIDPPYGYDLVNKSLALLLRSGVLQKGTLLVCESALQDNIKFDDNFLLLKTQNYKTLKIHFLEMR